MASRVIKSGSASVEFSVAPQPLRIADLDSDLDSIFSSIDDTNVQTGANIATSKLAVDGGIVTGMLANQAVTTAKIADGAVTPVKLALDGSTLNAVTANAPVNIAFTAETAVVT